MSVEAISWVLDDAPVDEPSAASVLVGLANHAGPDGRATFPSVTRLVRYTRLGERTVREYLDVLEAAKIIAPCDPAVIADHIKRGDRRPQGWDIDMTLRRNNPEHLARFQAALAALKEQRKTRRDKLAAKRAAEKEAKRQAEDVAETPNGVRPSPLSENERGATVAPDEVRPSPEPGATVAPEPSLKPSVEPSVSSLPAVGEVQHRTGEPPSGLRPGNEDHPDEEVQPNALVRVADIGTVYASLPEEVRARIGVEASPRVVDAIRAELAAGTRTVAQLVERVARRWDGWQRLGEQLRDPLGMAVNLVQRRQCPDVECEDGVHVETGERCPACAASRPRPAVPEPPVVGPSPRPDDGRVAEVLAPVPYVPEPGDPFPARRVVGRVPSGPPPGVLEATRARLHSLRGVHRRPAGSAWELAGVGA